MDQDVTVKSALRDVPALYRETSRRSAVSGADFARRACGWTLSALFASVWCHVSAQMSLGEPGSVEPNGGRVAVNHMAVGLATFTAVIFACDLKIATRTNHWTIVNVVALAASATLWFPFLVATSETWRLLGAFPDVSNAHLVLFASPRFWLAVALGAGTAAAADLAAANARRALRPSLAEVVHERESITSAPTNAITQRVAKALVASASTTMRAGKHIRRTRRRRRRFPRRAARLGPPSGRRGVLEERVRAAQVAQPQRFGGGQATQKLLRRLERVRNEHEDRRGRIRVGAASARVRALSRTNV